MSKRKADNSYQFQTNALMALALGGGTIAAAVVWYFFKKPKSFDWERVAVDPEARSLHAAAIRDGSMLIVGGCCDGTYLSDVLTLDLEKLTWSRAEPCPIACAGHSLVAVGKRLVLLAGIPSDKELRGTCLSVHAHNSVSAVYELDETWSRLSTTGDTPLARSGHSATLIANDIWIIGGENIYGELLDDMYILDMGTKEWKRVHTCGEAPPPIAFHGVASHNKQLYLFGGRTGGRGVCKDLYVFDCPERAWHKIPDGGSPRVQFRVVEVGGDCYAVGGGVQETTVLATPSKKRRVVSADHRLKRKGFTLVEDGRGTLFAAGTAEDAPGQFIVFKSKPYSKRPGVPAASVCEVREEDGSKFLFEVPKGGKAVGEIWRTLIRRTGRQCVLQRGDVVLTDSDMILRGEQVTLVPTFRRRPGPSQLRLWQMDARDCRAFLAQMEVKVTRGVGWLEPTKEIEADPFPWEKRPRPSLADLLEYLKQRAVEDIDSTRAYFNDMQERYHTKISSLGPKLAYELQFELQFSLDFSGNTDIPLVALWLERKVEDVGRWRAMVLLLALNIKSPRSKPWMVISDLKEDWEFAWMDGDSIFTSRAHSRKQALGILRDLARDCDKITRKTVVGHL